MKASSLAIMKEHETFMRVAIEEALKGYSQEEVPVGAVVVLNDNVIGRGYNRRDHMKDPTAHAEIRALREAAEYLGSWRLVGTTLYSTLEPCPMCAAAAVLSRVRHIVFGAEDLRWGACGTLYDIPRDPRLNHRCEVTGGVLAEECAKMLREFFLALR